MKKRKWICLLACGLLLSGCGAAGLGSQEASPSAAPEESSPSAVLEITDEPQESSQVSAEAVEIQRLGEYSHGLAPAKEGDRVVFVDEDGDVALRLGEEVIHAYPFDEGGLACVVVNLPDEILHTIPFMEIRVGGPSYFGFIGLDGEYVIPPRCIQSIHYDYQSKGEKQYPEIYSWNDRGTILTQMINGDFSYCVLDREGSFVQTGICTYLGAFRESVAKAQKDGKWGYINEYGEVMVDFQFEYAMDFHDGLAGVKQNGKWGYINHSGDMVIPARYDYALDFRGGYAMVFPDLLYTISLEYANTHSPASIGYIMGDPGSDPSFFYTIQIIDTQGNVLYAQDQLLRDDNWNLPQWDINKTGVVHIPDPTGLEPQHYAFEGHLVFDAFLNALNAEVTPEDTWRITTQYPPVSAVDVAEAPTITLNLIDDAIESQ